MKHTDTLSRITNTGILPVIRARSGEEASALVDATRAGGIDIIELTLTVPGAIDLIREMAARFGEDVVLGAGTVLDAETARACILAGARFVVSPALDIPTIECCRTYGVPVFPGALTPTEILTAWRAGATMVKIFPASAAGGASYVRAIRGPLPQIDLVPTGGVNAENVGDFIAAGAAAVGAGSDLSAAFAKGGADAVQSKAAQYVQEIKVARSQQQS